MASNEEFELQLRLEAEEAERNSHPVKESDNPLLRRDPNDGTLYEYDLIRKGWFPKIDDDFIAMYQASYGVTKSDESNDSGIKPESFLNSTTSKDVATQDDDQSITQNGEKLESPIQAADPLHAATKRSVPDQTQPSGSDSKRAKKSASAAPAEWFEMQDEHNRNVYVSNLPEELEEQEFVELMSKCGMVMKDPSTNRFKVKLYRDSNGHLKGDALCTYIKIESVQLAEQILDGSLFKDREIKVEKAKFQLKGQYDPTKKPRKLKAKDKQKMKQKLQK